MGRPHGSPAADTLLRFSVDATSVAFALVLVADAAFLPVRTALAAPAAPPTITQAGLTSDAYQQAFTANANQGYRLFSVSGYIENGGVRYAGLWRKVPGPAQHARHGMTQADYNQEITARGKDGHTLVSVTPFGIGGETRFNAIWEKRPSPALLTRAGMTGAEFQAWFNERWKAGMHLTQISGYTINGQARYAAIFEGGTSPVGMMHFGMSGDDLNGKIRTYMTQGYRLKQLSGYQDAGQDRYAAIWEKPAGGALHARWGINAADFQRVGDVERLSGWSPISILGFSTGSRPIGNISVPAPPRFTMLLETPFHTQDLDKIATAVNDGIKAQKVAGASVAIARNGRLLYAAGFGTAALQPRQPMDARHRLRIGSVSKMITSAAVYKLVEDGLLSGVDRKVFGPGGILENDVKLSASYKDLEGATIQQFLQHVSGLRGATMGRGPVVPDPVNCNAGGAKGNATLPARIQDTLTQFAKSNTLLGKPGDFDSYSNMSQVIAEAVIEKLSRRSYRDYVRSRVLAPAGLATSGPLAPALFTIGNYNAASGEAGHYDKDGKYASYPASNTCENEPPGTGAGGWAMSAVDLLRWFTSIDGTRGRVPSLLNTTNQTAFTAARSPKNPSSGTSYASGIFVNGRWGWCGTAADITQGHNGGVAGASSELWLLKNGFAIAVVVNQQTADGACASEVFKNLVGVVTAIDWPDADQF